MEIIKANTRGVAEHGWLHSRFSFSFANYYNPNRMGFGKLLVLNDDVIEPAMGFGLHPHDNMEIITIMLQGKLQHTDSMGHKTIINEGEVQVMSAGTGIMHSEYNASETEQAKLFQIWILPNVQNIEPRYEQMQYNSINKLNQFKLLVGPKNSDTNNVLYFNQNAFISIAEIEMGQTINYHLQYSQNNIYVQNISGEFILNNQSLNLRDAAQIANPTNLEITAITQSSILIIEMEH